MRSSVNKLLLVILGTALLIGCADRVRVELPPRAPVDHVRTVAVLPFENVTSDPSVAFAIEDGIAQALERSGWYDRVTLARVTGNLRITPNDMQSTTSLQDIGRELNVDAVITGIATYYFEDVYLDEPNCFGCNQPDRRPRWSVQQNTTVEAHMRARMIDVHSGEELHAASVTGKDWSYTTHDIGWYEDHSPPLGTYIPRPNRQQVPRTREVAITRALNAFTQDLLPRYEWRTVESND